MVNEFKLTVVHFARPNPMQICACAWIYRWTKKLWKIRTGPPGLRAAGLPGRRAAGPSRAVGRGPAFSKTRPTVGNSIKEPFRDRSCTLCKEFLIQTVVARFYSCNDEHQMVPLSSLMMNLPEKFIRGKLSTFLAG